MMIPTITPDNPEKIPSVAAAETLTPPRLAIKPAEAAELLGVSMPTVYELTRRADFPSFKIGNRTLISVELLNEWVKRQVESKEVGERLIAQLNGEVGGKSE